MLNYQRVAIFNPWIDQGLYTVYTVVGDVHNSNPDCNLCPLDSHSLGIIIIIDSIQGVELDTEFNGGWFILFFPPKYH